MTNNWNEPAALWALHWEHDDKHRAQFPADSGFRALERVDPGFNPGHVLTMNTSLSFPKLAGARRYAAFTNNSWRIWPNFRE